MRSTPLARLLFLLSWIPIAASAQIYKCTQADASTIYQDHECAPGYAGTKMDTKSSARSTALQAPSQQSPPRQADIRKNGRNDQAGAPEAPIYPLTEAVSRNNKDMVNSLLEKGADVNFVDPWYKTALDYAATKPGWSDIVEKLIAHGALCGVKRNGSMPIDTAADFESIKLIKACVLRQNHVTPSLSDTMYQAASRGNQALVLSLLTIGADINGNTNLNGYPPLFGALQAKKPEDMIIFLLDHGADVNATSKYGTTLLGSLKKSANKPANANLIPILLARGAREGATAAIRSDNATEDDAACKTDAKMCNHAQLASTNERMESCDPAIALKAVDEEVNNQKVVDEPLGLFKPALVLFQNGKKDQAVFWYYAAYLRVRYQLSFLNGDRAQLLTVMRMTLGPSIINHASQDPSNYKLILDKVLEWDKKTPNLYRNQPHTDLVKKNIDVIYSDFKNLSDKLVEDAASIKKNAVLASHDPAIMNSIGNIHACK